jgi:hypothetical protein
MQLRFPSALLIAATLLLLIGSAGSQPVLSQTRGAASGIGHAKTRVGRTRILYPRLTRYRDARVMREVNRQIDAATKEFTASGCSGKGTYFRVRSRVGYADRDIFSIYASSQYYCGGPYPTNDQNISQTFDLRTGKLVEFSDLFRNYEADKQEILKTIFGARIESAERIKASGRDTDDNCDSPYTMDNLQGTTFNYNFSATGLQIQPSWPHVIEACADIVTIPYSRLQRFAAPDGILSRMK